MGYGEYMNTLSQQKKHYTSGFWCNASRRLFFPMPLVWGECLGMVYIT